MSKKNPLIKANQRAMEYIWSQCPKEIKDGEEYVVYEATDLPALYYSGLVDTQQFTLKQWEHAFKDCQDENGRYWVNHTKMIFLGMFRYCRRIGDPFDPLKMRIGKYSVDRFWQVIEKSIIPSCALEEKGIKQIFDSIIRRNQSVEDMLGKDLIQEAKSEGQEFDEEGIHRKGYSYKADDGKQYIDVTRETLENLKRLLDLYPSPRRKMELGVQEIRLGKLQKLADQAAQSQKSAFEAGKDFRDTTKKELKDMLVKASEDRLAGRKTTGETLDLKKLQKKNRPTKF